MKASTSHLQTILKAILPNGMVESQSLPTENVTPHIDKSVLRSEILDYVNRLRIYVNDDWKSSYTKVWEEILDLEAVAKEVYVPGKQQGTDFNRNLVANIIHYLDRQEAYKGDYSASTMALVLEGSKDHPVRGALGKDPAPAITSRLKRYFE